MIYGVALIFLIIALPMVEGFHPNKETALKKHLFADYDTTVRPNSKTVINFEMALLTLKELSISEQLMDVTAAVLVTWRDLRLAWNNTDFAGFYSLLVQYEEVWQPMLVVENSFDKMNPIGSLEKLPLRIFYDGFVKILIPVNLKVFCEMSIFAFPFDTQACIIKFYGWGYDVTEMVVSHNEEEIITTGYYTENGQWDMIGSSKESEDIDDDSETYTIVKITLRFRRRWTFYGFIMIAPAILNSFLMCAVFSLAFECAEKMSYSLTVLLSYVVLLTLVAKTLPPISTEISALQMYLTAVMCVGTMSTLLTAWTVSMFNQQPSKPLPYWLILLVNKVVQPLLCQPCSQKREKEKSGPIKKDNDIWQKLGNNQENFKNCILNANDDGPKGEISPSHIHPHSQGGIGQEPKPSEKSVPAVDIEMDLHESDEKDKQSTHEFVELSWIEVARLMDSFFLRIISLIMFCITLSLIIFFGIVYN